MQKRFFSFLAAGLLLASCSKEGPKGDTGATGPAGPTGPAGSNGSNGQTSLTRITAEPAGANCASGGNKIETGLDANNNGVLDNSEVNAAQTKYVCNGATGTANVIYSDWFSFSSNLNWKDTAVDGVTRGRAIKDVSTLTSTLVNQGAIFTYYKSQNSSPDIRNLPWQTGIHPNYIYYHSAVTTSKIIFFRLQVLSGTSVTNSSNYEAEFRYILIPGGVSGGRFTSGPVQGLTTEEIKRLSYEQVAQLLKIPASGSSTK